MSGVSGDIPEEDTLIIFITITRVTILTFLAIIE